MEKRIFLIVNQRIHTWIKSRKFITVSSTSVPRCFSMLFLLFRKKIRLMKWASGCVCACVCVCVFCSQMTVHGALWLAKLLSLNLNFSFLNRISLLFILNNYLLSSLVWVDPIPDPILPEKFLGYSQESNPGPLGRQSDVLTNHYTKQAVKIYGIINCNVN